MQEQIPRNKALHPFQNGSGIHSESCIQCSFPKHHRRHGNTTTEWCSCGHAKVNHLLSAVEAPCLVEGCSCTALDLGDTSGRLQELGDLRVSPETEGKRKVDGERQEQHGDPVKNLAKIAEIWTELFDVRFTAHDVALAMLSFKAVRQVVNPEHSDNLDDIEGYAEIARRCVEAGLFIPKGQKREVK